MSLRSTIESLAAQFAASVLDALRSASLDELAEIAGAGRAPGARSGRGRADPSASASALGGRPSRARVGRADRLERRTASDITRMIESIVAVLAKSPNGLRAEQLRTELGVESKELPRPLADALASGRVTKTGQKRATTYFARRAGGSSKKRR